MSKYEAIFHCALCGKDTPIPDENVEKIVMVGDFIGGLCSCGGHSYESSIRATFEMDLSKWRCFYGSLE